jgi:hypothetical protein
MTEAMPAVLHKVLQPAQLVHSAGEACPVSILDSKD